MGETRCLEFLAAVTFSIVGRVRTAALWLVGVARAAEPDIPPEGIGKGIQHISYSDIGGRPDSVQVMFNRQHSMSATCSATA